MGTNNNRKFSLYQYPTGQDLHWSWMNDEASTFCTGTLTGVLTKNKWIHVCITYEKPNLKIYINGVEKHSQNNVYSASSTFEYETELLASANNRNLNDFRLYDHCLSPREVKLLA
jgi:hypothetical protein